MVKTRPQPTTRVSLTLVLGLAFLLVLHLATSFSPAVTTWGIDYWSELPVAIRAILFLIAIILLVPQVGVSVGRKLEAKRRPRWAAWAGLGVAFVVFFGFRSHAWSYGDGYTFRNLFPGGELPPLSGNLLLLIGDMVTHWAVYRVLLLPLGGSVETAYSLVSAAGGVVALAAIARMARVLFPKDQAARWGMIAAGFTSGMAFLWFGHVEAYTLVGAALLWSLAFLMEGRAGYAWFFWVIACVIHMLAVAFLPVLLWPVIGKRILARIPRAGGLTLAAIGFVGWGVATMIVGGMRPGTFVPVQSSALTTYTAFGADHLRDTINLLVYAAPLGLIGLFALIAGQFLKPSADETRSDGGTLLLVAGVSLWLFAFWVDPLIGMFRDWDLLGVFGIPLSLWGAWALSRSTSGSRTWIWPVLAVFALAHTGAFVAGAQNETKAMERVDRMVDQDRHYSREFYRGERRAAWAHVLAHILNRTDLAIRHVRLRAEWEPRDPVAWKNMGSGYWLTNRFDSAAMAFQKAVEIEPNDPGTWKQLGVAESRIGNDREAATALRRLIELVDTSYVDRNALAMSYIRIGLPDSALPYVQKSLAEHPEWFESHYLLGQIAEAKGDEDGAILHYEDAVARNGPIDDLYYRLSQLYQARGDGGSAVRVAQRWVQISPGSAMSHFVLGMAEVSVQSYQQAEAELLRSVELEPNNAFANFYLATTYRNLKQPDRAKQYALRAAGLDSTLALPYLELVYLAADAGDHAGAVSATREYLRRSPGDSTLEYLKQFMEP